VVTFPEVPVLLLLPVLFGIPAVPQEEPQEYQDDQNIQQQVIIKKGHIGNQKLDI